MITRVSGSPLFPLRMLESDRLVLPSHSTFSGETTSTPNQALERTAARCMFTFQMIKTVSVPAGLAFGGGRSACFR